MMFFDSNVLVYAEDRSAEDKQDIARKLITETIKKKLAVVSLQTLQEFFAVATCKLGVSADIIQSRIEVLLRGCHLVRLTGPDLVDAIELHRLHSVSFWDSLVVQAARSAGAVTLYSEDLQHGRMFGATRVVNPFLH